MASRDVDELMPELKDKFLLMRDEAKKVGIEFIVTCTSRTLIEQMVLYSQGRMGLKYVNKLRVRAGMARISENQSRKVTWTLHSEHIPVITGTQVAAFDIALKRDSRAVHWDVRADLNDNDIPDYEELGMIGEKVGLTWGGRFKNSRGKPVPDMCHFQLYK